MSSSNREFEQVDFKELISRIKKKIKRDETLDW